MKLSVSNLAWEPTFNPTAAQILSQHNIKYLEITPGRLPFTLTASPNEISDFRRFWQDRGIDIIAMQSLLFGGPEVSLFSSPAARSQLLAYLKQVLNLGQKLGTKAFVFGSPKNRLKGALSNDQANSIAQEFFTDLGDFALKLEVNICIEANPLSTGADFLTTTKEALSFVQNLNHPAIKLQLDTGTLYANQENPTKIIPQVLPHIGHAHLSQPSLTPLNLDYPHDHLIELLKKHHYQGFISLEMAPIPDLDHTKFLNLIKIFTELTSLHQS